MRRYALLAAIGLLAGLGALLAARVVQWQAPAREASATIETEALTLVIGESGVEPTIASVPKGRQVALAVRNDRTTAATLVLQGYEDRFTAGPIAPGAEWRGTFVADLPGEAFAWLVNGEAVGRFSVTGSHLVEGHR